MKFQSCGGRLIDPPQSYDDVEELEIGDFYFHGDSLFCRLPCDGRGYNRGLPIYPAGQAKIDTLSWSWNGNRERPALKPSIRALDGKTTVWHGYLTEGVFKACE